MFAGPEKTKLIVCKTRYAQKKMFAEKSEKLLKNRSSKTEIYTKSNNFCYKFYQHRIFKLNKHKKDIQLGISKLPFYNIKTNNKIVNSWFFSKKGEFIVAIKSQHYLFIFYPIKLHIFLSKLYLTNSSISAILITANHIFQKPSTYMKKH